MGNSQVKRNEEASDLKDALLHRTGAADARAEGRGQDNGAGMPGGGEPHHDGGAANVSGTITDPSVGAQEGEPMVSPSPIMLPGPRRGDARLLFSMRNLWVSNQIQNDIVVINCLQSQSTSKLISMH
ncbi:hypothetical protein BRADI_2g16873v3 [Brachypodium distachyon]|uniref:Uncharacterized protein n=1 Tax=Brachypodium distachyon TaxID=15368 RepID=A0A2K2D8Y5_BRADI|nr:hypothetical protein BRADI_2g16873v3 [Brachypodium distachyon]